MSEREKAALKIYRETVDQAWKVYKEVEAQAEIVRRNTVAQAWKAYAEVMAKAEEEAEG